MAGTGSIDPTLDFSNTEVAFRRHSNSSLRRTYLLFLAMSNNLLVDVSSKLMALAVKAHLPVIGIIKSTLYRQFCGGESIEECLPLTKELEGAGVGSIIDYSVEGKKDEGSFDRTRDEILATIDFAGRMKKPSFAVFKPSGLGRTSLMEKVQNGVSLSEGEKAEFSRIRGRFLVISERAELAGVRLMVDAEDFCFQACVDDLVLDLMKKFNRKAAVIYNTVQMYRRDRLRYVENLYELAQAEGFYVGLKIVRGAYLERERALAVAGRYSDPIHGTKADTDQAYDQALEFSIKHIDRIWIVAGTHNESSSRHLAELLDQRCISRDDSRVVFSQLLGMSDNLSYNLAHHGFIVRKYVPYGPVKEVIPYLIRRAHENTSIKGQTGRELEFLRTELSRRRAARAGKRTS